MAPVTRLQKRNGQRSSKSSPQNTTRYDLRSDWGYKMQSGGKVCTKARKVVELKRPLEETPSSTQEASALSQHEQSGVVKEQQGVPEDRSLDVVMTDAQERSYYHTDTYLPDPDDAVSVPQLPVIDFEAMVKEAANRWIDMLLDNQEDAGVIPQSPKSQSVQPSQADPDGGSFPLHPDDDLPSYVDSDSDVSDDENGHMGIYFQGKDVGLPARKEQQGRCVLLEKPMVDVTNRRHFNEETKTEEIVWRIDATSWHLLGGCRSSNDWVWIAGTNVDMDGAIDRRGLRDEYMKGSASPCWV